MRDFRKLSTYDSEMNRTRQKNCDAGKDRAANL